MMWNNIGLKLLIDLIFDETRLRMMWNNIGLKPYHAYHNNNLRLRMMWNNIGLKPRETAVVAIKFENDVK